MDQAKIGKFIAERRKKVNLTQIQLAEQLFITDRAVSKWETGKAMPDISIMIKLCEILKISVNDLLCGEVLPKEDYDKELENNLIETIKQKELSDKRLLRLEFLTAVLCLFPLLAAIVAITALSMEEWIAGIVLCVSLIPAIIATPFMIRIEQVAGYYQCGKCGHKYVPKYKIVFKAMHVHTARYMKCPNCKKRSWHKKSISKD